MVELRWRAGAAPRGGRDHGGDRRARQADAHVAASAECGDQATAVSPGQSGDRRGPVADEEPEVGDKAKPEVG
jgi:hypothetical protein